MKWRVPQSRFKLCRWQKGHSLCSPPACTRLMTNLSNEAWGSASQRGHRSLLNSQMNRQQLLKNALRHSISFFFLTPSVFVFLYSHLLASVKQDILQLHSVELLISLTAQSGTVNLVSFLGWSDSFPGRMLGKHNVWNLSGRGQNYTSVEDRQRQPDSHPGHYWQNKKVQGSCVAKKTLYVYRDGKFTDWHIQCVAQVTTIDNRKIISAKCIFYSTLMCLFEMMYLNSLKWN